MPVVGLQESLSFSISRKRLLCETELAVRGSKNLQALNNGLELTLSQLSCFKSEVIC